MSDQKQTKPKVPDGHADYYVTRQLPANEKGYVGYETIWKPWQKEAEYTTPNRP